MSEQDKPQPRDWLMAFVAGGCVVDVLNDFVSDEGVMRVLVTLIVIVLLLNLRAWHQRTWVRRSVWATDQQQQRAGED